MYALNSAYTRYQLIITYFEDAQNQQLSISITSPARRLLHQGRLTQTLSISLSLSLTTTVNTQPPALYVPQSQSRIYTTYLMWLLAGLHILTLVVVVVILVMRLKVMLLVIDVIVALSTLYLLSGVGFYGATLLAHESSRGLQPFVYPWG